MNIQTFDFSVDLLRALLWQYNDAARLETLLREKQAWYTENQQEFWESWYRDVFDLRTANEFGLTVWSIILDVPLTVGPPSDAAKPTFGFASTSVNFDNGNLAEVFIPLSNEQARLVLRMRYFQLITCGAVPEINAFLADVFADQGVVYVTDGLNMTAEYIFNFPLDPVTESLFATFDLLPRPAGVEVNYTVTDNVDTFGFGRYHFNFNNGNLYHA